MFFSRRQLAAPEQTLVSAMRPWEQRLTRESLARWSLRGGIAGLGLTCLVLLVGWVYPQPEAALRPLAFELAVLPLLVAAGVGLWPAPHRLRAADLDTRLNFGDRLTTAWAFRHSEHGVVALQRSEAVSKLRQRSPRTDLLWRPARAEVVALGVAAFVTLVLCFTPSPQQGKLDQQAAQQMAVQQANQRLQSLRQDAVAASALTPDQARQLDELLQQAQVELDQAQTPQDAANALAQAQDQVARQLGDPNADLRDQALAAMSETLAAEPRTQALADAIQREDARASAAAVSQIAAGADQLSDVERQGLSRALQRAANVGHSDPQSAAALSTAAQALASGDSAAAQQALSQVDAALQSSIQASQASASLEATEQRLRDLQARVAAGTPLNVDPSQMPSDVGMATDSASGQPLASGTPVALDSSGSRALQEPSAGQGQGAGVGAGDARGQAAGIQASTPAETVYVPGRAGNGPADQNVTDQPFTVRGAPRPYRDVLAQYAQSSRDYVDRPDVSPAVRDLVKQYFQQLENGQ
jgi:hypothetical protein